MLSPTVRFVASEIVAQVRDQGGEPVEFGAGCAMYKLIDGLDEFDWTELLDELARDGVTLEYDHVEDEFAAAGGAGI